MSLKSISSKLFTISTAIVYLFRSTRLVSAADSSIWFPQFFFQSSPNAAFVFANIGTLISALLPNIIVVAGVVFTFIIVINGFNYINSAGNTYKTPQELAKIRQTIIYALIGLLIVISSYFILQIITTVTGINFINSPVDNP